MVPSGGRRLIGPRGRGWRGGRLLCSRGYLARAVARQMQKGSVEAGQAVRAGWAVWAAWGVVSRGQVDSRDSATQRRALWPCRAGLGCCHGQTVGAAVQAFSRVLWPQPSRGGTLLDAVVTGGRQIRADGGVGAGNVEDGTRRGGLRWRARRQGGAAGGRDRSSCEGVGPQERSASEEGFTSGRADSPARAR